MQGDGSDSDLTSSSESGRVRAGGLSRAREGEGLGYGRSPNVNGRADRENGRSGRGPVSVLKRDRDGGAGAAMTNARAGGRDKHREGLALPTVRRSARDFPFCYLSKSVAEFFRNGFSYNEYTVGRNRTCCAYRST